MVWGRGGEIEVFLFDAEGGKNDGKGNNSIPAVVIIRSFFPEELQLQIPSIAIPDLRRVLPAIPDTVE